MSEQIKKVKMKERKQTAALWWRLGCRPSLKADLAGDVIICNWSQLFIKAWLAAWHSQSDGRPWRWRRVWRAACHTAAQVTAGGEAERRHVVDSHRRQEAPDRRSSSVIWLFLKWIGVRGRALSVVDVAVVRWSQKGGGSLFCCRFAPESQCYIVLWKSVIVMCLFRCNNNSVFISLK